MLFGYFMPTRDGFEVTLALLLINLNSIQGIVELLSSPRVFDGEMLKWERNKKDENDEKLKSKKNFQFNFLCLSSAMKDEGPPSYPYLSLLIAN